MRWIAHLLAVFALSGCAAEALTDMAGGAGGDVDPVRGQTILFVGTDPATLRTNIYQVQAISQAEFATDEERNAAVLFAEGFEVTVLTDLAVEPEGPLQDDGDVLLPSHAPFAVPDRLGERVAFVVEGYDFDSELPVGRAAVVDLIDGTDLVVPEVPDLVGVRFTWLGQHLLLEHRDPTTGAALLSTYDLSSDKAAVEPVLIEGASDLWVSGLEPQSDRFYVLAFDDYGPSTSVVRVDPTAGTSEVVAAPVDGYLGDLAISPDGAWLAATTVDPYTGARTVSLAELGDAGNAWVPMTDPADADCSQPAWNPAPSGGDAQIACVCVSATTGRPDVVLWSGAALPEGTSGPPPLDTLTGGAQPSVPDGSMDGLVVRARLRWDPTGRVLMFGASSSTDAAVDSPMSLLVLDPATRRAEPVYDEDDGDATLPHFAAASADPVLLVWDVSTLGTEDSVGRHPIQLVAADPEGPRTVRGVNLGRDLIVEYPLFLGGNTLLYP